LVPDISKDAGVDDVAFVNVPVSGGLVVPRYTLYPAVPLAAFQLRVADVEIPVAPVLGEASVGAGTAG
jgi:hypothetical protein